MTQDKARNVVTMSAVIVGAIYAYRRFIEGSSATAPHTATKAALKQVAGSGPPPPLTQWLVGYGFAFMIVSVIAQLDPNSGAAIAGIIAVGTTFNQGGQLSQDVTDQLTGKKPKPITSQAYAIGAAQAGAQLGQGALTGTANPATAGGSGLSAAGGTVAGGSALTAAGSSAGSVSGAPSFTGGG